MGTCNGNGIRGRNARTGRGNGIRNTETGCQDRKKKRCGNEKRERIQEHFKKVNHRDSQHKPGITAVHRNMPYERVCAVYSPRADYGGGTLHLILYHKHPDALSRLKLYFGCVLNSICDRLLTTLISVKGANFSPLKILGSNIPNM